MHLGSLSYKNETMAPLHVATLTVQREFMLLSPQGSACLITSMLEEMGQWSTSLRKVGLTCNHGNVL